MVKAGKFGNRAIQFAGDRALSNYGPNAPVKKMWHGTVTKLALAGAAQLVQLRGPTWGFEWIEYAEVHSRGYTGATQGGVIAPTIQHYYNTNPSIYLGATLGVQNTHIFMRIWGR